MDLITVRDLFKNTEKYAGVEVNVGQGGEQERGDRWQQEKILAGRRQWQEEQETSGGAGQDWLNTLV